MRRIPLPAIAHASNPVGALQWSPSSIRAALMTFCVVCGMSARQLVPLFLQTYMQYRSRGWERGRLSADDGQHEAQLMAEVREAEVGLRLPTASAAPEKSASDPGLTQQQIYRFIMICNAMGFLS